MPSFNPFLRAFFSSGLVKQCLPTEDYILLVPTTDVCMTYRDRNSGQPLYESVNNEEFLASHVIKVGNAAPPVHGETGPFREQRMKPKQFHTLNNRIVVIKDSNVHCNKGFKHLVQAQLLTDLIYHDELRDPQQWLIYYISRPLLGDIEPIKFDIASVPGLIDGASSAQSKHKIQNGEASHQSSRGTQKIETFNALLQRFPVVAKHIQGDFENIIENLSYQLDNKPTTPSQPKRKSRRSSSVASKKSNHSSIRSRDSRHHRRVPSNLVADESSASGEEERLRKVLEDAVSSGLELFQTIDNHQLSMIGSATGLTGPEVEVLIEEQITGSVFTHQLFPQLKLAYNHHDAELESQIKHMNALDISQIGMDIENTPAQKRQLLKRIGAGVKEFQQINNAATPQKMLDVLLKTQRTISGASPDGATTNGTTELNEKSAITNTSADELVSLMLIVVIRAEVRNLRARLSSMQNLILIADVESGEAGYALSTLEAVLTYIVTDSAVLRKASHSNKRLWTAVKTGDIPDLRSIMENGIGAGIYKNGDLSASPERPSSSASMRSWRAVSDADSTSLPWTNGGLQSSSSVSNLSHIYPSEVFSGQSTTSNEIRKTPKKVSMDLRSLSGYSDHSVLSYTSTNGSAPFAIEADVSVDTVSRTHDPSGRSVLMMAVENDQQTVLDYLLSFEEHFPLETVLDDENSEGTTLLSMAAQLNHTNIAHALLSYLNGFHEPDYYTEYLSSADTKQRTVGHYLFNLPELLDDFGPYIPWTAKDVNGQTPLMSLCRCYDHPLYADMIEKALSFVVGAQNSSDSSFQVDDHVDTKGNTLLHVLNDAGLVLRLISHADADLNAVNDKQFTPIMIASKYGRVDLVRTMLADNRIDIRLREARGMTATELAKDDEIRNRIDDIILVSRIPTSDNRVTGVIRALFVDDGSTRNIIKSATRSRDGIIAITTCRRSVHDVRKLLRILATEQPASWVPPLSHVRSPFQIPSRPSRAVLHNNALVLDKSLRSMLEHATFSTHELLWEFVLVPELQLDIMQERSSQKAAARKESMLDEFHPVEDPREVIVFAEHARTSVRSVHQSTRAVVREANGVHNRLNDLSESMAFLIKTLQTLQFLTPAQKEATTKYSRYNRQSESEPTLGLSYDFDNVSATSVAMISALAKPHAIVDSLNATKKNLEQLKHSLQRNDRWNLSLLEDSRKAHQQEIKQKIAATELEIRTIGCELRYSQHTIANELAGWQVSHERTLKRSLRQFAKQSLIKERDRFAGLKRVLRTVRGQSTQVAKPEA